MDRIQKHAPGIVVGVFVLSYLVFGSAGASDPPAAKVDTVPAFVASEGQNVLNVRAVTTLNNYQGGPSLLDADTARSYAADVLAAIPPKRKKP